MFFQSPLPDYTPESPGWVFSHLAPTECWLPFPRRSWPLSSFLVSRCTYAGSLSLRLAPTLHRGLKRLLSLSSALAASCLMTLYMANSFHLARTTKLRLALRGRDTIKCSAGSALPYIYRRWRGSLRSQGRDLGIRDW